MLFRDQNVQAEIRRLFLYKPRISRKLIKVMQGTRDMNKIIREKTLAFCFRYAAAAAATSAVVACAALDKDFVTSYDGFLDLDLISGSDDFLDVIL